MLYLPWIFTENQFWVQRDRALEEIERLRQIIRDAPHGEGCYSIQPEFLHTPQWGSLDFCDCWKRDALREK